MRKEIYMKLNNATDTNIQRMVVLYGGHKLMGRMVPEHLVQVDKRE